MDFKPFPKLAIQEVVWEDHFSVDDWTTPDSSDVDISINVTTIGYLLKETKTKIVLIQTHATNAMIAGTMTILKKTVKSRVTLREAS